MKSIMFLQKPVLYLVELSSRSRIDELNEDIYSFVKERYFVGEEVDAIIGSKGRRYDTSCVRLRWMSKRMQYVGRSIVHLPQSYVILHLPHQ